MLKAIITDLDRTLLRDDKSVSEYTVRTMRECRERGLKLIAATARPLRAIRSYEESIGFDAVVSLNGAVVLSGEREKRFFVDEGEVRHILAELMAIGDCVISLETTQGIYSNVDIPEWSPVVCKDLLRVPILGEVLKILVSSEKHALKEILDSVIGSESYYSIAGGTLFQIMNRAATKWNGIETLLGSYGIAAEQVLYFGDDHDDIEPIRRCGVGIAVANSIAEVKAIADVIIDSNENDGVAKYINEELFKTSDR